MLTAKQSKILKFISKFTSDNGYPPTRAEISESFGFKSHNSAQEHLTALQKKGVIKIVPGISRGIILV